MAVGLVVAALGACAPTMPPPQPAAGPSASPFVQARSHERTLDAVAEILDGTPARVRTANAFNWVSPYIRVRRGVTARDPKAVFARDVAGMRHTPSGLLCPATLELPPGASGLTLRDAILFDADGLDVGCRYSGKERIPALTVFATYAPRQGLSESVESTKAAVLRRFPKAGERGLNVAADSGRMKTLGDAVHIGTRLGEDVRSAVWVTDVQGWKIKVRLTYFADTTYFSELGGAVILLDRAEDIDRTAR